MQVNDAERSALEIEFRSAASLFLNDLTRRLGGLVRLEDVADFHFRGERVPLSDRQRGIRKPRQLSAALSISTAFRPAGAARPYEDEVGCDGYLRYKWRGTDPSHPENVALRQAMLRRLPLIWFRGVAPALYVPIHPVWLLAEEESLGQFVVALDDAQLGAWDSLTTQALTDTQARYGMRMVKQRLHQPIFRAQVILAYQRECAVCRLRHVELLDAAHIKRDAEGGQPVVPNGISMCKLHHAAFDAGLFGVRGDYVVQVRESVRDEADGPVLRHALQEVHGTRIQVPPSRASRPDRSLLEERFEAYLGVA